MKVEHILCYSKQPDWNPNKLPRTAEMDSIYKNPDNDIAAWASDNLLRLVRQRIKEWFMLFNTHFTGEMLYPTKGRCWTFGQEQMLEYMLGWCNYELRELNDASKRADVCGVPESEVRTGVKGIVLSEPPEVSSKKHWRFIIVDNGQSFISQKVEKAVFVEKLILKTWRKTTNKFLALY